MSLIDSSHRLMVIIITHLLRGVVVFLIVTKLIPELTHFL